MSDINEGAIDSAVESEATEPFTSRRRLFQIGAIGAAAVAGGAIVDAMSATQAGATTGDPVLIGELNEPTTDGTVTSLLGSPFSVLGTFTGGDQAISAANLGGPGLVASGSSGGYGTWSATDTGIGVIGTTGNITDANPVSASGTGVVGHAEASVITTSSSPPPAYGVVGVGNVGVYGATNGLASAAGPGVVGVAGTNATSPGLQGKSSGGGPQLMLVPLTTNTLPTADRTPVAGSFCVLNNGDLYYTFGGSTYYLMTTTVLLANPIRILDTRVGETDAAIHPDAPIHAGGTLGVQITGEAVGGISVPAGAKAVIGNVTAVNALAHGYLTLWPEGATQPTASSINYPVSTSIANGVTVALSATGQINIFSNQQTDVVFDATAFIF